MAWKDIPGLTIAEIAIHIVRNISDENVVVGPLVWEPSDGTRSRIWYFIVAVSQKGRGFKCDQIRGESLERFALIAELTKQPSHPVIHVMDDELQMARLCEMLWPGDRVGLLVDEMEGALP